MFGRLLDSVLLGAGIGAITNPEDPLKGGLVGGATGGLGAAGAIPNLFSGGGLLSGGAGAVPTATNTMAETAVSESISPSVLGAMDKTAMDDMLLRSGNITEPGPGLLAKTQDFLGLTPDPYGPEASLKANQVKQALPQDKPGFTSQLTTGLLSKADKFVPDKEPVPTPQSGPSLRQQQAPAPQSLFMQFNRRRR